MSGVKTWLEAKEKALQAPCIPLRQIVLLGTSQALQAPNNPTNKQPSFALRAASMASCHKG